MTGHHNRIGLHGPEAVCVVSAQVNPTSALENTRESVSVIHIAAGTLRHPLSCLYSPSIGLAPCLCLGLANRLLSLPVCVCLSCMASEGGGRGEGQQPALLQREWNPLSFLESRMEQQSLHGDEGGGGAGGMCPFTPVGVGNA